MLSGSSALHHEGTKQITTPKLQATLRANDILLNETYVGITSSGAVIRDGIDFLGFYLFPDGQNNIIRITHDLTGVTIGANIPGFRAFYNTGNTLLAFGHFNGRTPFYIISSNGANWGTTTLLGIGISQLQGMAIVGPTRLYGMQLTEGLVYDYRIVKIENVSGTWGVTTVGNRNYVAFGSVVGSWPFGAKNIGDIDYLLIGAGESTGYNILRYHNNIKVLKTDGSNILKETTIIEPNINGGPVVTSRLGVGLSRIYFQYSQHFGENLTNDIYGPTRTIWDYRSDYVLSSVDMENWTIGYDIGATTFRFDAISGPAHSESIMIAGLTSNREFLLLGSSFTKSLIAGVTTIDISSNIMSYSNNNNERISLALGNYK